MTGHAASAPRRLQRGSATTQALLFLALLAALVVGGWLALGGDPEPDPHYVRAARDIANHEQVTTEALRIYLGEPYVGALAELALVSPESPSFEGARELETRILDAQDAEREEIEEAAAARAADVERLRARQRDEADALALSSAWLSSEERAEMLAADSVKPICEH